MNPALRPGGLPALPGRFEAVQGLRAWAMLLVFSFHLNYLIQARWPNAISQGFLAIGGWGTNLFLCVAGCFMYRSLCRRPVAYGQFLTRRFRRLYPVYAFVLTLVIALDVLLRAGRTGIKGDWEGIGLLAGNLLLVPALLQGKLILDASWTLAYIAVFTLLAPGLTRALMRLDAEWRVVATGALWGLTCAGSMTWGLFPARVTLMMAGVFVWELMAHRWRWRVAVLSGVLAAAMRLPPSVALIPVLLMVALAGPAVIRRILSWPVFQQLGERSYSFYLCHGLPVLAGAEFLFPRIGLWQAALLSPLMLGAALAFSECVFRLVEQPLRQPRTAVRELVPVDPAVGGFGVLAEVKRAG